MTSIDDLDAALSTAGTKALSVRNELQSALDQITILQQDNDKVAATANSLRSQLDQALAQIAALQQPDAWTMPAWTPPANVAPLGTGATYQRLNNSTTKGKVVDLGASVFEISDFTNPANDVWGTYTWDATGICGRGAEQSTVQMRPRSSTKAAKVPPQSIRATNPGAVNPLWLLVVNGQQRKQDGYLGGFTLQATDQGHLYNGAEFLDCNTATLDRFRGVGIPGNASSNPGETFTVQYHNCGHVIAKDSELNGANVAGSLLYVHGDCGDVTLTHCYLHDTGYGSGFTAYQHKQPIVLTDARIDNCFLGINLEHTTGPVTLTRPHITGSRGRARDGAAKGQPIALSLIPDAGVAPVTVTDPIGVDAAHPFVVAVLGAANVDAQRAKVTLTVDGNPRPDLLAFTSKWDGADP